LLATQEDDGPKSLKENTIEALIDKDTKALLRACSMLRSPKEEDIISKQVKLG